MATLPPTSGVALTLADWAARVDDNKQIASIVELLSQSNEIMDDMLVMEGNLPTGHKTTIRTGLPSATWRLLNYGVAQSKSTTAQIVDAIGNLEAFSRIDRDLADLNGNTAEFRLSESKAFLEAMTQQMASTLIYGNTNVNPERFMGLAPRFNTLTTSSAQTAYNVINAGGTGADNTSIWLVVWGPDTVHGIFPRGKPTGLRREDMGQLTVYDANSLPYIAYQEHYKWELGLSVKDWRYVVRICNIDVSDLTGTSAANLINLLVRAVHRPPTMPRSAAPVQTADAPSISGFRGRAVLYCNRVVSTYLDLQAMNKTNVLLQMTEWNGAPVTLFRGIPIRTVDAILSNEATIT